MGLSSIMGVVPTEHEVFALPTRGPRRSSHGLESESPASLGSFSMWLQEYLPQLTDRVRVYNTVLRRQPRFIPCLYGLYGRWLKATLWRNIANVPRRRRRIYSLPIPTLAHQGRWEGCVDLPARRG